MKYRVACTVTRAFPPVSLLALSASALFSTQHSRWDSENAGQIASHAHAKVSSTSRCLEGSATPSRWSARPRGLGPFFDLISSHHLSFLRCSHYTAIPAVLCTCQTVSFSGPLHVLSSLSGRLLPHMSVGVDHAVQRGVSSKDFSDCLIYNVMQRL